MKLHKLLIKLSQMGSIFIEIFDAKVLNAIYPMVYISRLYGKFYKCKIYIFHAKNWVYNMVFDLNY